MKRALAVTLTSSLLALAGCDQVKKIEDEGGTGSGSAVPAQVQLRITQSCAISGCHVSGAVAPDLSEAAGGAWVTQSGAGGPFVSFGDVDNSYLIEKMFPAPGFGTQMPLPPGELSAEDLAVIVGWVAGVEFPDGETESTTTGSDTEDPTMDTGSESSDTNAEPTLCSLEVVGPDVTSPVDAGDEAGKIPSSVGAALERNCGCHYVSSAEPPYVAFGGGTQLQTLANFTSPYAGAVATYMGQPAWMAVQDRVITQANMPTATCETEEGGTITAADFALFEAWFQQEVPDGASFTPPS